jgi:thioredoxin-like negative regulator of GroEL
MNDRNFDRLKELLADEKYDEAVALLPQIREKHARTASDFIALAKTYGKTGDFTHAEKLFKKAYRLRPSKLMYHDVMDVCLETGHIKDAEEYLAEYSALPAHDEYSCAVYAYRILKKKDADRQSVIEALKRINRNEYTEKWAYELAKQYYKAGMEEECKAECEKIVNAFKMSLVASKASMLLAYYNGEVTAEEIKNSVSARERRIGVEVMAAEEMAHPGEEAKDLAAVQVETAVFTEPSPDDPASEIIAATSSYGLEDIAQGVRDIIEEEKAEEAGEETDAANVEETLAEAVAETMAETPDPEIEEITAEHSDPEIEEITVEHSAPEIEEITVDHTEPEIDAIPRELHPKTEPENAEEIPETEAVSEEGSEEVSEAQVNEEHEVRVETEEENAFAKFLKTGMNEEEEEYDVGEISVDEIGRNFGNTEEDIDDEEDINRLKRSKSVLEECFMRELNSRRFERSMPQYVLYAPKMNYSPSEIKEGKLRELITGNGVDVEGLCGNFFRIDELRRSILKSLELAANEKGALCFVVTGEEKSGKSTLAVTMIRLMHGIGAVRYEKTAKINAEKLNRIDLIGRSEDLKNCNILVENAGALTSVSLRTLVDLYGQKRTDTCLILEDNMKRINSLFRNNERFNGVFNNRIHLPKYSVDELMGFAYDVFTEADYSIESNAAESLKKQIARRTAAGEAKLPVALELAQNAVAKADKRLAPEILKMAAEATMENYNLVILEEDIKP